jgi:hypothetical protein
MSRCIIKSNLSIKAKTSCNLEQRKYYSLRPFSNLFRYTYNLEQTEKEYNCDMYLNQIKSCVSVNYVPKLRTMPMLLRIIINAILVRTTEQISSSQT